MKELKNLFVPYELALKLKEKGFDEPCLTYYFDTSVYRNSPANISDISLYPETQPGSGFSLKGFKNSHKKIELTDCTAPLYQQVIDWFREKHRIHIRIDITQNGYSPFIFLPKSSMDWTSVWEGGYYEALNKAIEEAIKLI